MKLCYLGFKSNRVTVRLYAGVSVQTLLMFADSDRHMASECNVW